MSAASTSEFTAVGEATVNGRTYVAAPVAFGREGVRLSGEVRTGPDGEPTFVVRAASVAVPGEATFEKTGFEPVLFNLYRDGEPMQQVVLKNAFDRIVLNLNT